MKYRIRIHDDEDHTFEYVVALFCQSLGIRRDAAFALASEINNEGSAVVERESLEHARVTAKALLAGGLDPRTGRSDGSLVVSVEEFDEKTSRTLSCGREGPSGYEELDAAGLEVLRRESEWRMEQQAALTGEALKALAAEDPEDTKSTVAESFMILMVALGIAALVSLAVLAVR